MRELDGYEREVLRRIQAFKNPERGLLSKFRETLEAPVRAVTNAAFDTALGSGVGRLTRAVFDRLNDGAAFTVRHTEVFARFRKDGVPVHDLHDIHDLHIRKVDEARGHLSTKYRALAFGEGAGASLAGPFGIVLDLPALIALGLRATNEYAAFYGFDVKASHEQDYALQILTLASSDAYSARQTEAARATELGVMLAGDRSFKEVERVLSTVVARKAAEIVARRLSKGRLARLVPALGVAIGGAYAWSYLGAVCEAAEHMYQERFLIRQHGPEIAIAVTAR